MSGFNEARSILIRSSSCDADGDADGGLTVSSSVAVGDDEDEEAPFLKEAGTAASGIDLSFSRSIWLMLMSSSEMEVSKRMREMS